MNLTWAQDPRTTIDVTWRTDVSVDKSIVEYAPGKLFRGNLLAGVPGAKSTTGQTKRFESDISVYHLHLANHARLQLFALAYNLANFLRRLALPYEVKQWSLTTPR